MKQWVEYLGTRTDERGIIVREEQGGWCLGDWCTPYNRIEIPAELVNTAFYYHVACTMAEAAKTLNKSSDETKLRNLSETIKENFNSVFYDSATNHYWKGKQGADAIALAFGLVPEDKKEDVFAAMLEYLETIGYHFDTGIFGTPLTLKALTGNGRIDAAYKLMNRKDFPGYGYLMDNKNSTLWETWDGGVDDLNGSGRCHPMFGSVVAWFYNSLAGIKPDKSNPGMKHFYIEPGFVPDLNYCKASYKTLYGEISSDWMIDKNGDFNLKVDIPVNTSATITFPEWGSGFILESGIPVDKCGEIAINKDNPSRIKVLSGSYNFIVLKNTPL
jgi:alpha-L-rhamnosidase